MTIASQTSKVTYNGNGSTLPFSVPFYFVKNADLVVILTSTAGVETTLTITTHYTLTGAGVPAGGTCTMVTAPATGEKLTIKRSPAIVQEVDYVENTAFPAATHEAALDLLTMVCQDNAEKISRAVAIPISSSVTPTDYLTTVEGYKDDAETARDAAQGYAVAADVSADNASDSEIAAAASAAALPNAASVGAGKVPQSDGTTWTGVTAGDMLKSNNLSGLANTTTARSNLGLAIGSDVQAYDADTMKSDVVTARTRAHSFTPVAVTAASGGALAIDCDLHEECTITLAETTTTVGAASNQAAGKYVVLIITGATGKSLAWNTNWDKDGADCAIAAPANGVTDMHCFRSNGTAMKHIGSKLAV